MSVRWIAIFPANLAAYKENWIFDRPKQRVMMWYETLRPSLFEGKIAHLLCQIGHFWGEEICISLVGNYRKMVITIQIWFDSIKNPNSKNFKHLTIDWLLLVYCSKRDLYSNLPKKYALNIFSNINEMPSNLDIWNKDKKFSTIVEHKLLVFFFITYRPRVVSVHSIKVNVNRDLFGNFFLGAGHLRTVKISNLVRFLM